MPELTDVIDNQDASRFEMHGDGRVAELVYDRSGDRLTLIHTGVPPELEGHGVGGKLVTAAVDRAERDGLVIVPLCPFASSWLRRHPEVASRVPVDWAD